MGTMEATAIKEQIVGNEKLKAYFESLEEGEQTMAIMILSDGYMHRRVSDYEEEGEKEKAEACRSLADDTSKLTKMVGHIAGFSEKRLREIERGVYRCLKLQKALYIF